MNGFLQDGDGNNSSSRLIMVAGIAFVLAIWGFVSVKNGAMASMPQEIVWVMTALIGGKVGSGSLNEAAGLFFKKLNQPKET